MKSSINLLDEIIERQTGTTIVALKVCVVLYNIKISSTLILVLLRITADRTSEVIEISFNSLKFL